MKRGKIFLILLISIVLLTSLISAEEKILEEYTSEEWKSLDLESKNQVWKKTPSAEKISFLKTNYPSISNIQLKGFDHETLTWQEGEILGNKKTWVDLTQLPEGLTNLEYDGEKFIYDFGDGEISTDTGSVNNNGNLVGVEDFGEIFVSLGENGEMSFSNGKFIITEGASFTIKGIIVEPTNKDLPGELNIFSEDQYILKNIKFNKLEHSSVVSYNEPVFVSFNKDIPEEYLEQYVLFNTENDKNTVEFQGKSKMDIRVQRMFDEVKGIGQQDSGVRLLNGDVEIEFDGTKTKYPRSVRKSKYTIKNLVNGLDPENNFRLQKYETVVYKVEEIGENRFKAFYKTIPVDYLTGEGKDAGSILINSENRVIAGSGKFKQEQTSETIGATIATYKLELPQGFEDSLPEGIESIEEFSSEVEDTGKSFSFQVNYGISGDQILEALQRQDFSLIDRIQQRTERIIQQETIFGVVDEAFSESEDLSEFIQRTRDIGNLVSTYPEETYDLMSTIAGIGYDKDDVSYGNYDKGTTFTFDSRKDPALLTITYKKDAASMETAVVQRTYPQAFINEVVNQLGAEKLVDKAYERYQQR